MDHHDIIGREFTDLDLTVTCKGRAITIGVSEAQDEELYFDEIKPKDLATGLREIADWLDTLPTPEAEPGG